MRINLLSITVVLLLFGCVGRQSNENNYAQFPLETTQESIVNYCDCQTIHRDDGTDVKQCISLPVAHDKSLEVALAIATNGKNPFITVTIKYNSNVLKIVDDLSIRLNDNSMLTFRLVNEGVSFIGNYQVAQGVFSLDNSQIQKLKASELKTISIKLEDKLVHTLECTDNISILKTQLLYIANSGKIFSSGNYEISIPKGFKKVEATGPHIDLKFVKPDGTSILVNVSDRTQEEYNITAHDYSKELLEKAMPEIQITKVEKTYINNIEAFLIYYNSSVNSTTTIEVYLFNGDHAYVLTATSKSDKFSENETTFLETIYSLKFGN